MKNKHNAAIIILAARIPLLEKAGLKKWGNLPEYQRYINETPCLVPFVNW